jgi:hypothetical protein
MYHTDCVECGKTFEARRKTAKYCSPKCRQRFNRRQPQGLGVGVHLGRELSVVRGALDRLSTLDDDTLRDELWKSEMDMRAIRAFIERVNSL